jgi:putative glutathione S-transferase
MNMLVDGEWRTEAYDLTDEDGNFVRETTSFRNRVEADPDADFPAEAGRYHLYVSYACPWAHRTLLARTLLGLEDAISVDVVDPHRRNDGWEFAPEKEGCTTDSQFGAAYLRDVYTQADPDYTGRVTVPVLWDKQKETIVNNESRDILRILDTAFTAQQTRDVTLLPEDQAATVDETIDAIYEPINNGVYRAGFAEAQDAYETAVSELFDALDTWEERLAERRYLCGDQLTEADVCMFTTLIRFDHVYHGHFKCNRRRIVDYPNLWNYLKELYQLPGIAETVDFDHITAHYYRSHTDINPTGIVPIGPDLPIDEPHDRDRLAGGPPAALESPAAASD